ncbi:hypothetical protein LXA43DRAFT_1098726 [Ganoderma leucocontextum]|nr:hypothetical protein LXA43DRAFT_1098726 [Ganoderma leucocontextum]
MAFFKADDRTLARDKWPADIGRVLQEREKSATNLPRSKLVPCERRDLPTWLCVETQPDQGRAVVLFRSDVECGEDDAGVEITVRLQGVISEMNLGPSGSWDGTLQNIHKAQQQLTLVSGGCAEAFAPQHRALANIRHVVLTMLGKTGLGQNGREGTISLRKRVFTKVDLSVDEEDRKPSAVEAAEDPTGRLRRYDENWRILEKIRCGRQEADGSLQPLHVSLLSQGDFVDVLATITVPLTCGHVGPASDLMVEPKRILRLRTAVQVASLLHLPSNTFAEPPPTKKRKMSTSQADDLEISEERGSARVPAKKKKRGEVAAGSSAMEIV